MSHRRNPVLTAAVVVALALFAAPARGEDKKDKGKTEPLPDCIVTALPIFADVANYRQQPYGQRGVQYLFAYISDIQANVSGGVRRGIVYEGRLETKLDINLEKFAGWQGGRVYFNAFAIHGRGLTRYNIHNI